MKYLYTFSAAAAYVLANATTVLGQAATDDSDSGGASRPEPERLLNPLTSINSIPEFFQAILDIVMVFAIPFIVFFIIYAGFMYVLARGNPDQITKAHRALLFALIGGVLILAANALLAIVTGTVNQFTSP